MLEVTRIVGLDEHDVEMDRDVDLYVEVDRDDPLEVPRTRR